MVLITPHMTPDLGKRVNEVFYDRSLNESSNMSRFCFSCNSKSGQDKVMRCVNATSSEALAFEVAYETVRPQSTWFASELQ